MRSFGAAGCSGPCDAATRRMCASIFYRGRGSGRVCSRDHAGHVVRSSPCTYGRVPHEYLERLMYVQPHMPTGVSLARARAPASVQTWSPNVGGVAPSAPIAGLQRVHSDLPIPSSEGVMLSGRCQCRLPSAWQSAGKVDAGLASCDVDLRELPGSPSLRCIDRMRGHH